MKHYLFERKAFQRKGRNDAHRAPRIRTLSKSIVIVILISAILQIPTGNGNGGRSWGNESFETATEIPADGSPECMVLHYNGDPVDYLKFFLALPPGKSINATIHLSAESISHTFFVTVYSPDKLPIHHETVQDSGPPMDYSFWAGTEDFYYMSISTFDNNAVYETRVNTTLVDHPPDYNNNMSHAPVLISNTTINGRVNETTDYYDIYRIHIDANDTHGEGLFVHMDDFADIKLEIYDTNRTLRASSNIVQSSDPDEGETIRFVANRTGFYHIVVMYDIDSPQADFANYVLTVNTTAGVPRDEDWCPARATPITQGLSYGSFDSTYDLLDHYLLEFEEGDKVNVSVIFPDMEEWDINITIANSSGGEIWTGNATGNDYCRAWVRIPGDGTYSVGFGNPDWKAMNYTYLITTDGKHFGNVRPVSTLQSCANYSFAEDTSGSYRLSDVFINGAPRTFQCTSHGEGSGMNLTVLVNGQGHVTFQPPVNWFGSEDIRFQCTDYFNFTADFMLNTTVTPVNDPPEFVDIAGIPMPSPVWLNAVENQRLEFTVNVSDIDNTSEELKILVGGDDPNLRYDETGNMFQYYTDDEYDGIEKFVVEVSDGLSSLNQEVGLNIRGVNDAPVARSIRVTSPYASSTITLETNPAYDEEGDVLTYTWTFGDGNSEVDVGLLSVSHTYDKSGSYPLSLEVSDGELSDTEFSQIFVFVPLDPPVDTDLDGVPDEKDAFPKDPAASVDKDGDGYPDKWNSGETQKNSTMGLELDLFPEDPLYHRDSDNDGMPDEWELEWGLDPNDPLDREKDSDRDGYSNRWEYLQGTDPGFYIPTLDEQPWLWKNMTREYGDGEGDDLYQIVDLWNEEEEMEITLSELGSHPEIDLLNLKCGLNGTELRIELSTRGMPLNERKLSRGREGVGTHMRYLYNVYLVDPCYQEGEYSASSLGPGLVRDHAPVPILGLNLEYPSSFPELDYEVRVNGTVISFDISLKTLVREGMEPSTDFEIFSTATLFMATEDLQTCHSGYDSLGSGAYQPAIPKDSMEGRSEGTTSLFIYGGIGILMMSIVIVVAVMVVGNRRRKREKEKGPGLPTIPHIPTEAEIIELLDEAALAGVDVAAFREDLVRAITYIEDEEKLGRSLRDIYVKVRVNMKGTEEPEETVSPMEPIAGDAPVPAGHVAKPSHRIPPLCRRCMRVAEYYSEYDRYWCDTCQDYVDEEESGGKKPVHEPTPTERATSPPPLVKPPVNTPADDVTVDAAEDNPLANPIWTESLDKNQEEESKSNQSYV